eukprot:4113478-Pyramimonas_sp.AAC.1
MVGVPERAAPWRVEGVGISSSAEGGESKTGETPPAEAGEADGAQTCAPERWQHGLVQGFRNQPGGP